MFATVCPVPETFEWILPEFLPELEIYNCKVYGTVGIRHISTQHEPVTTLPWPVCVVLIYVVYPLCRKLLSCIFLIPVKIPVKSNSSKIHSKVSDTVLPKGAASKMLYLLSQIYIFFSPWNELWSMITIFWGFAPHPINRPGGGGGGKFPPFLELV